MKDKGLHAKNWDERYAGEDYVYGTNPNQFLVSCAPRLSGKKVLCIADGEGRNGVWLARQGFEVTSIDFSARGLEKARKLAEKYEVSLNCVQADVTQWDYSRSAYDAIISVFAHFPHSVYPDLARRWIRALKPGGHLVLVGYDQAQLGRDSGGPKSPDLLYDLNQIQSCFHDLDVLYLEKGEVALKEGALHQGHA
ncbi:MAG: methyltransferase domain-containing protein, partial [Fidelibacterota bacterium]